MKPYQRDYADRLVKLLSERCNVYVPVAIAADQIGVHRRTLYRALPTICRSMTAIQYTPYSGLSYRPIAA